MLSSLTIPMHACIDPPQALPADVFPGSSCLLLLASPLNPCHHGVVSSVLGSVSMQAAETWHGKANPNDTEVVTCFPQGCREQGGGGRQDPPTGELQHPPVCAAWLHLILFALVPNTHLPREVCLDQLWFRLRLAISCHAGAVTGLDH